MSFPDLQDFVQQQFSAFSGYDEAAPQLVLWCHRQRQSRRERDRFRYWRTKPQYLAKQYAWKATSGYDAYGYTKAWRKRNPEKQRALDTKQKRRWRVRHPDKAIAQKRRQRAKRPEHYRELNRKNQASRRARIKAQQSLQPETHASSASNT